MTLHISENVIWEELSGELIVFKLDNGQYYRFNNTGLIVWKGIADSLTKDAIIEKMASTFTIDSAQSAKDIKVFLAELEKEKLITDNEQQ